MAYRAVLKKLREWLGRYGVAEVLGTAGALGGAELGFALSGNIVVGAYAGALGENLGFYGTMIWRLWRRARRAQPELAAVATLLDVSRTLVLEFGPAELLDTGIIRPLAMGLGMEALGRFWGALAGKLVGDALFYIPVIASYELRRWRNPEQL
jgi:hypothetical protein